MIVLGLSGSLRVNSHNTRLLRAAVAKLPPGTRLLRPQLFDLPPFSEDTETWPPQSVRALREAAAAADAVLVATPEYNASLPGQLKNALDWLSRPLETNPLRRKPALVVGASTGLFGAVWAQADARRVLTAIGADVIDDELPVGSADTAFAVGGALADPDLDARLGGLVAQLSGRALPLAA